MAAIRSRPSRARLSAGGGSPKIRQVGLFLGPRRVNGGLSRRCSDEHRPLDHAELLDKSEEIVHGLARKADAVAHELHWRVDLVGHPGCQPTYRLQFLRLTQLRFNVQPHFHLFRQFGIGRDQVARLALKSVVGETQLVRALDDGFLENRIEPLLFPSGLFRGRHLGLGLLSQPPQHAGGCDGQDPQRHAKPGPYHLASKVLSLDLVGLCGVGVQLEDRFCQTVDGAHVTLQRGDRGKLFGPAGARRVLCPDAHGGHQLNAQLTLVVRPRRGGAEGACRQNEVAEGRRQLRRELCFRARRQPLLEDHHLRLAGVASDVGDRLDIAALDNQIFSHPFQPALARPEDAGAGNQKARRRRLRKEAQGTGVWADGWLPWLIG